ncbi:terminase, partial [Salmonella enterica subsp. salamae]|nr:terminase [Salmonella enterica subsp. salamae]
RLSKNSGEIIMATRWATDDLSGRVIANSSKAKVLAFPAINERGEALVPELHPLDKLLETKAILGDYFWSAMYQQSPKQAGGSIFKDEWIKYYLPKDLPTNFDIVIHSWDMTFKDSEGTDYVVGQVWGKKGANSY